MTKAQGSTGDSPKQSVAPLTAYSEPERRGTPDYKHEIQRVEAKLEEFFRRMDARINDLARRNQSVKNRQDSAHENDGLFVTRVGELVMYSKIVIRGLHVNQVRILSGTVCYRCGRRSHIHYYYNCNQSNDGFRKERQILHRAIQPTYRQPEESSTYKEEDLSDAEGTVSQLESQETPQTTLTYYRR